MYVTNGTQRQNANQNRTIQPRTSVTRDSEYFVLRYKTVSRPPLGEHNGLWGTALTKFYASVESSFVAFFSSQQLSYWREKTGDRKGRVTRVTRIR